MVIYLNIAKKILKIDYIIFLFILDFYNRKMYARFQFSDNVSSNN